MDSPRSANNIDLEESSIDTLTVDVKQLNSVLGRITTAIRRHATLLNKVSQIEESQLQIQKELSLFRLNDSSQKSFESAGIVSRPVEQVSLRYNIANDEAESKENTVDEGNQSDMSLSARPPRGLSIRRLQVVNNAVRKIETSMAKATISDLRKDVVGLKAIVSNLQQELNVEIVHSSEIEYRVDSLKSTLTGLESEHGPGATTAALQHQREFMVNKVDTLLHTINEVEASTKNAVDSKMNEKVLEMKSWFSSLESMVRSRQSQLNSKMSLFAKTFELSALEENINNEFDDYKSRVGVLESSVLSNEDALLQMRQHASFLSFQNIRQRWKARMLGAALKRWKDHNDFVVKEERKVIQRKKNVRKVLIRTWLAKKSNAWKKWQNVILWHKKLEATKDSAVRNIIERMQLTVSEASCLAFNKWRRATITMKIQKCKSEPVACNESPLTTPQKASAGDENIPADSIANQYDLSVLLDSFHTDKDGAIQTLAQEINNIKAFDIRKARQDMEHRIEETENRFNQSLSTEVSKLQMRELEIEEKLDDKFDSLSLQLPQMKSEIAEMRNSLHGTINRVKVIEQTHRDSIELLFEGKEAMEEEMMTMKAGLSSIHSRLNTLEYSNDRSQNSINTMLQNMNDFETFYKGHKESTDLKNAQLNDALAKVTKDLTRTKKQNDKLNDDLIETRNNLIQSKVSSETAFKEVHGILDSHGTLQPKWRDIIEYGGLFESKSKEKSYVVPINFSVDGRIDLDIPGSIADFAQDYAAWIAFEADRDALKLVVIGKNPENAGYIEDNTQILRNSLVDR